MLATFYHGHAVIQSSANFSKLYAISCFKRPDRYWARFSLDTRCQVWGNQGGKDKTGQDVILADQGTMVSQNVQMRRQSKESQMNYPAASSGVSRIQKTEFRRQNRFPDRSRGVHTNLFLLHSVSWLLDSLTSIIELDG